MRPYSVKPFHDCSLGHYCIFTTELVESGGNLAEEFALMDQQSCIVITNDTFIEKNWTMLWCKETENKNDPPSGRLTIENTNESLQLGLLILTCIFSKQQKLNNLAYTWAQTISMMKSFLAECKYLLQTLMELTLKTKNGKEHKSKNHRTRTGISTVTVGYIPDFEGEVVEIITGKQK